MQEVISVSLQTKSGTSVATVHLHLDGTWKLFSSHVRTKGRHAAKIRSANLPGYIRLKALSRVAELRIMVSKGEVLDKGHET